MAEFLSNIQPVILVGMMITLYSIENIYPYLKNPPDKKKHDRRNLGICIINFAVNALLSFGVLAVLNWTTENQSGVLNMTALPQWVEIIIGILAIDFGSYGVHNLSHSVPLLWRFHRVHHSDLYVNVTTSLRFHPVETILTQGIYQAAVISVMGISPLSFAIYGTIAIPLLILQHSNVKLPEWIEKHGRLIFSTPGWHKIHHSIYKPLTDSHFGDVFTFWDRIFRTWKPTRPEDIGYGLENFSEDNMHTVGYQMKVPFKNI